MGETDLQLGGGYIYQWECAVLLALNYFVFLTNRPFNPDLARVKSAIREGTLVQCAQGRRLRAGARPIVLRGSDSIKTWGGDGEGDHENR
jgi:hypothetical protein